MKFMDVTRDMYIFVHEWQRGSAKSKDRPRNNNNNTNDGTVRIPCPTTLKRTAASRQVKALVVPVCVPDAREDRHVDEAAAACWDQGEVV